MRKRKDKQETMEEVLEEDLKEEKPRSRTKRREELESEPEVKPERKNKKKSGLVHLIILIILTLAHIGLTVYYFFDSNQFIGLNFIFPVPNVIYSSVKEKWLLFFINLITFGVGIAIMITRINKTFIF